MANSHNPEEVLIALKTSLDLNTLRSELATLEKAIASSEKKIETMRVHSAQTMATLQQSLNEKQKIANKERLSDLQKGLTIEVGVVNTLTSSYNKYLSELQKVTSVEKARNDLGIKALDAQIAKVKEYTSLTVALGAKSTNMPKTSVGYGSFRAGDSVVATESTPISFTSKAYTDRIEAEKKTQAELDAIFDKKVKERSDKALAIEEETNKRKIAIRKLDEEAYRKEILNSLAYQKKLELEKEHLYQKVNQNMLEQAQLLNAKNIDAKARARLEEIKQENLLIKEKLRVNREGNRQKAVDDAVAREKELAELRADITKRSALSTKTSDASGRKVYGDYSDVMSRSTTYVDPGTVWKNMQADAGKAGAASAREYSKTFWGAIEGGTTFGHKLATTFQYATAGTAFYTLAGAVSGFTTAIIEADKYSHMFQGVLEMTASEAETLQKAVYATGKEIGGTTKGISEAALMLGRAGLENEKLAKGLRVAAMAANVSGDSIENITEMLAAWQTVYPKENIEHLGDMMAKIANESLLSIDGLKTATSYITASGAAAGVTADQLIELAGAWKQTGKADSIVGTEIRRLFAQIESGSDDVRKAYWAMGIDVDKVNKGLKSGIKEEQEAAFRAFMEKLGQYRNLPQAQKASVDALIANLQVLDKQTVQSGIVAGESFAGMEKAGTAAAGSLEKASNQIALSYEKMIERITATLSEGASRFESGFTTGFAGAGATLNDFNVSMEIFSEKFNKLAENVGKVLGATIPVVLDLIEAFLIFKAGSWLMLGIGKVADISGKLGRTFSDVDLAVRVLTKSVKANPLLWGFAVVESIDYAMRALFDFDEQARKNAENLIKYKAAQKEYLKEDGQSTIDETFKYAKPIYDKIAGYEKGLINARAQNNKAAIASYTLALSNARKELKPYEEALIRQGKIINGIVDRPKANIGADGNYVPKTKDPTQGQIESAAKNLTDEKLRQVELAEQQYFYERNITSDLEQKKYHVSETLKKQKEILEASGFYKNKEEDILKKNIEIWKAKNDIKELEYQSTILSERRLEDINTQLLAIGKQSEEKKIELKYNDQLIALDREREDILHKKGMLSAEDQDYLLSKLELLQKMTEEERKQLEITRARAVGEYTKTTNRRIEDRKAMTDYEKYSLALSREIADEEQKQYEMSQDKLNYVEMQFASEERIADLRKQNSYAMYVGMTLQQSLQSELNSSLMDFFDIQSEGWMDFERLGMNVLNNILKQMLQMQVVQPLATAGSSYLSSLGSMAMSWLASADGNVFDQGHVKAYAKGGTFTNSIVKKPTYFASGGTLGVMGESGPELVAPLKRDSQGRMGVIVTGSEGGSKNITINIKNESGETLAVTQSEAKTDMSGMVLDIVIDAITRNKKGMRDIVRGGR